MKIGLGCGGAVLAAFLVAIPAGVSAQNYPPPPPPGGGPGAPAPTAAPSSGRTETGFWQRYGFYGGLGLGGGSMQFEDVNGNETDSRSAFAFHLDGGFHLSPQLGLVFDAWGLGFNDDEYVDVSYVHAIFTVGAQYWITPLIYARGGLGGARFSVHADGEEIDGTETVAGFMAGVGIEALSSPNFSLDVEGRVGSGFYDDGTLTNVSVSVAVRWHTVGGYYAR